MSTIHLFLSFGIFLIGLAGALLVGILGWSAEFTSGLGTGWKITLMILGYGIIGVWLYWIRRFRQEYVEHETRSLAKPHEARVPKKKRK